LGANVDFWADLHKNNEIHAGFRYHALNTQIKKITVRYDKLRDDICSLVENAPVLTVLPAGRVLAEELQKLKESKQRLEALAASGKKLGSYKKRNRRDPYLFLLAHEVFYRTGDFHVGELATLINSAHAAHGEPSEDEPSGDVNEENLGKRIQRFADSINPKVISGRPRFPSRQR